MHRALGSSRAAEHDVDIGRGQGEAEGDLLERQARGGGRPEVAGEHLPRLPPHERRG